MKTVSELIKAFRKDSTVLRLSQKQYEWLKSLGKKEKCFYEYGSDPGIIRDGKDYYLLRHNRVHTRGYGGLVGKKIVPGYHAEVMQYIRFKNTGFRQFATETDLCDIANKAKIDPEKFEYEFLTVSPVEKY